MKTFNRICIEEHTVRDYNGATFTIERGKEYLTSFEKDGKVTVFTKFWMTVPVSIFAGEVQFTE